MRQNRNKEMLMSTEQWKWFRNLKCKNLGNERYLMIVTANETITMGTVGFGGEHQ
jgi:hypothetical protein